MYNCKAQHTLLCISRGSQENDGSGKSELQVPLYHQGAKHQAAPELQLRLEARSCGQTEAPFLMHLVPQSECQVNRKRSWLSAVQYMHVFGDVIHHFYVVLKPVTVLTNCFLIFLPLTHMDLSFWIASAAKGAMAAKRWTQILIKGKEATIHQFRPSSFFKWGCWSYPLSHSSVVWFPSWCVSKTSMAKYTTACCIATYLLRSSLLDMLQVAKIDGKLPTRNEQISFSTQLGNIFSQASFGVFRLDAISISSCTEMW